MKRNLRHMSARHIILPAVAALALYGSAAQADSDFSVGVGVGVGAGVNLNFDYAYSTLAPYGAWRTSAEYGQVWQPAGVGDGWRPYANDGHWVYTDTGWMWYSDYQWGWLPFHHGRWYRDPAYGWSWVPGYTWAPAWVTWYNTESYVGWAPIAPVGLGVSFTLAPSDWFFVSFGYFVNPYVGRYYVAPGIACPMMGWPYVVVNDYYFHGHHYYDRHDRPCNWYGPPPVVVERHVGRPLRRYSVVESNAGDRRPVATQGERIEVFRPPSEESRGYAERVRAAEQRGGREAAPEANTRQERAQGRDGSAQANVRGERSGDRAVGAPPSARETVNPRVPERVERPGRSNAIVVPERVTDQPGERPVRDWQSRSPQPPVRQQDPQLPVRQRELQSSAHQYTPPQSPAHQYVPPQSPTHQYTPPQSPAHQYVPPQSPAREFAPSQRPAPQPPARQYVPPQGMPAPAPQQQPRMAPMPQQQPRIAPPVQQPMTPGPAVQQMPGGAQPGEMPYGAPQQEGGGGRSRR